MKSVQVPRCSLATGTRWLARALSAFLIGVVVLMLVGTGGFNPLKFSAKEAVQMTFFLLTCCGMVAAWRFELIGHVGR
jgi:hypothetical protein